MKSPLILNDWTAKFYVVFRKWSSSGLHLWMNLAIQSGVNTEIKIRHLWMNENNLYHPLTGNMKSKDLPLFITSSTKSKY